MRLQNVLIATCREDGGGSGGRKALQGGTSPVSPRTSEPSDDYDPVSWWRESKTLCGS